MSTKASLSALPLGGVGEFGVNLMVYECDGEMLIVDVGLSFPGENEPGTDSVLPDIAYVRHNLKRLKGIVITHAHEDHIGGLPYLWEDMPVPVYLTQFSRLVLEGKLEEIGLKGEVPIHQVTPGERFTVGSKFDLEFINITHSIPEANSLVIRTPHGTLVHTGDYKLDDKPGLGAPSNVEAFKKLGDEGVLAMFGDSTNIFKPGGSGSEAEVKKSLDDIINGCKERVFFCTFASNVGRLVSGVELARKHKRKAAFWGRSMQKMIGHARTCGFLPDDFDDYVVSADEALGLPRNKAMIFVTGSQGEGRAALGRLSMSEGPLHLDKGDTIILSSKIIPGNEKPIYSMINRLIHMGARVVHEKTDFVHVSGHAAQDEIKKMYELLRPEVAVPVHGDYSNLVAHAAFAKQIGIKQQIVFENGQRLVLAPKTPHVAEHTEHVGKLFVDGYNILDEDKFILKERRQMASDGVISVAVAVDGKTGKVTGDVQFDCLGLLDTELQADLVTEAKQTVDRVLHDEFDGIVHDAKVAKKSIGNALRRLMRTERGRKPIVLVQVVACAQG